MSDSISRQDAVDAVEFGITYAKAFDVNTGESKELFKEGNDALKKAVERLKELPSAEPKTTSNGSITCVKPKKMHDRTMGDLISRQEATTIPVMPVEYREYQTMNLDDAYEQGWFDLQKCIEELPYAKPERLTDDDFETIRIHLNAYKEKLCNQQRWEEAEEYQRIIDRFMAFASAEPERKKGKWKGYNDGDPNWQRDDGSPIFLICSECHETVINNGSAHWNFCPNCGADMRGEQE